MTLQSKNARNGSLMNRSLKIPFRKGVRFYHSLSFSIHLSGGHWFAQMHSCRELLKPFSSLAIW